MPPDKGGDAEGDDGDGDPLDLASPDLHLLTFLWLIERNGMTFDVTGFQAKRLYEKTGDGKENVGQRRRPERAVYSGRTRHRTGATHLEGREAVKEADDVQTAVWNEPAETICDPPLAKNRF